MIIDDSHATREYLRDQLCKADYSVITAADGHEAFELVKMHSFDIVLCDMQMPIIDGPAFRRKLLAHPKYAVIPFVAMSTFDTADNFQAMRELKAAAFLTKPFKPEQLLILLDRLLADSALLERTRQELARLEKKMLLNSIMSLAHALDARDPYTHSHSDCVSKMAVSIGRKMHLDSHSLEQLWIAGRLHDIGKIGIQDCVLQKPGKLTAEEFAIIKTHPAVGAKILKPIPSLGDVAEVIHSHHEHFDGCGYPRGLKGENIHLFARILSIADVYDALISHRPYRKGYSHRQALSIMEQNRGKQFCPVCLDAFLLLFSSHEGDPLAVSDTIEEISKGSESFSSPSQSPHPMSVNQEKDSGSLVNLRLDKCIKVKGTE